MSEVQLERILNLVKSAEMVAEEMHEEDPTTFTHDLYASLTKLVDDILEVKE